MENKKRLIDANAFECVCVNGKSDDFCNGVLYVLDMIDVQPTVDAVEVVHAHWEDGCAIHNGKEVYKSIDCSNCNEIFKIESRTREYWKERFKVCPFCGAVMDGGNEDG